MFYNDRGIKRKTFAPRIPPQNKSAKRKNKSIMDSGRNPMMENNDFLKNQREVVRTTISTLNYVQAKKVTESENVKFDEYTKVHEVEPMKEHDEYESFV